MDKETFRERYTGKAKERYNKAIRNEIPGGPELLALLMFVHNERRQMLRGYSKAEAADILETIEDQVQDIRDEMVHEIKNRYKLDHHKQ